MANLPLPPTGAGSSGKTASTVTLSNGADVQNVQVGAAVEGGSFTPVAIATQATLAAVLAALGSPYQAAGALPLPSGASTETTVAAVLAKLNASIAVTGPLTDTQLRATAVAISASALPLPSGASTETTLAAVNTKLGGTLTVTGGGTPVDLTTSGTISTPSSVTLTGMNGMSTALVDITANTSGGATQFFEGSVDGGTTWEQLLYTNVGLPTIGNTSLGVAAGLYIVDVQGCQQFRVRCSAIASGAYTVTIRASAAGSFPVRTVTTAPPSNASTNVAQISGTAADANSGVKSNGTLRVVLATDQPALTNALKVDGSAVTQPVSGTVTTTPPANASTNLAQVAGATVAQGHGVAASALRVELPTDGTGVVGLAAGAATIGALAANQSVNAAQVAGTATAVNSGALSAGVQRVTLATDQVQLTNALKVDPSAVTSPVSLASVPSHAVTNAGTFAVQATQTPGTSGGYSIQRVLAAASTNATSVKASAGQVFGYYLFNSAAYTVFLKLYNKASAPTVGTDTPVITIPIPAGAAANVEFLGGIAFGTGIALATTKLVADADTTVLVANDLIINLFYK